MQFGNALHHRPTNRCEHNRLLTSLTTSARVRKHGTGTSTPSTCPVSAAQLACLIVPDALIAAMQLHSSTGAASSGSTAVGPRLLVLSTHRPGGRLLQTSRRLPLTQVRRHGTGASAEEQAARQYYVALTGITGLQLLFVSSASAAGLFAR